MILYSNSPHHTGFCFQTKLLRITIIYNPGQNISQKKHQPKLHKTRKLLYLPLHNFWPLLAKIHNLRGTVHRFVQLLRIYLFGKVMSFIYLSIAPQGLFLGWWPLTIILAQDKVSSKVTGVKGLQTSLFFNFGFYHHQSRLKCKPCNQRNTVKVVIKNIFYKNYHFPFLQQTF